MLRKTLLFLSEREGLKDRLLRMRAARETAARFVAGDTIEEALEVAGDLESRGFRVTLDLLGESVHELEEAARAARAYEDSLAAIAEHGVRSTISLKLTQLGLGLDLDASVAHLEAIVERAAGLDSFVRVDMEGSDYTEATLDAFRRVFETRRNVGIVIQSYLLRSQADIDDLIALGAPVRLCKGAYNEPPSLAYQRREDIDAHFVHLMRALLEDAGSRPSRGGVPPAAIATHDDRMIEATQSFAESRAVPVDAFEFQMLYGVRREYQTRLLDGGYHVRIYVPYGTEWYPYFMRRMAERPANLWFVTRALLGR